MPRATCFLLALFCVLPDRAAAQPAPVLPPGDPEPLFRLEAGGPLGFVTALAFSPDGGTLYAAGWDKVVRTWRLDAAAGTFALDERTTYRVPIGPGVEGGALNALAVSPDGTWLATGGLGVVRGTETYRRRGQVLPLSVVTEEMLLDQGMIYVFNLQPRAGQPALRILRGHRGSVVSLAFVAAEAGQVPRLVAAGREMLGGVQAPVGTVRLWDVEKAEALAAHTELPDPLQTETRPGLAAWATGPGPRDVRVALAAGDGSLRVWDAAAGTLLRAPDGEKRQNKGVVLRSGPDGLWTSSYRAGRAHLQSWQGGGPALQPGAAGFDLALAENGQHAPWALASLAARADGAADHFALYLQHPDGRAANRLHICRVDGTRVAEVPLWQGAEVPVLAAAPRGRHVAVAGNGAHEILVFRVADLVAGKPAAPQRLRSAGSQPRAVAFVTQGKDLGLLLSETPRATPGQAPRAPQAGDLVFDVARRRLAPFQAGDPWQLSIPPAEGWSVQAQPGRLTVFQDGAPRSVIPIRDSLTVSDYALLPPRQPFNMPVLAVALHRLGEPRLRLYHGETGEQFREYTGHTGPIRALAFSADGRLLASVADDQTVSIWSLTDLDTILGQRGRIPGLEVQWDRERGDLRVVRAAEAAAQGLRAEERIEGVLEGQELRRFDSTFRFYEYVWRLRPGTDLALRVGGQRRRLKVGQGIDSQKPLLSFFVTRPDGVAQREWIGWSTLGHYDVSDRKAERHLGWHFNTGNPDGPTRFAFADQYSKVFHRPGILQQLLADGKAPAPAPPQPPPRPNMTLWIEGALPDPRTADAQDQVLVQDPRVVLKLRVENYPADRVADWIEELRWQVDEAPPQPLASPRANREWSADLSRARPWQRGVVTVRVLLRTKEIPFHHEARTYTSELRVRYQPRPPQVKLLSPEEATSTSPEYTVQALVQPGTPGQAVRVRLYQRPGDRELLPASPPGTGEQTVRRQVTLQPGSNVIELVAVNEGALAGYEASETTRALWRITHTPPAIVPPPVLALEDVRPLLEGDQVGPPLDLRPRQPVVVAVPVVQVGGTVKATENLAAVRWTQGEMSRPAAGFDASGKELVLRERFTLQPGRNRLHLSARTATSKEADDAVVIDYRPALPRLQVQTPTDGTRLFEGKDEAAVAWRARLLWTTARHPCQAEVLVNGQPRHEVALKPTDEVLEARVPLQPGRNQVQVRLRNAWERVEVSEPRVLEYLRPPVVKALTGPEVVQEPRVTLTALVRSATPLEGVEVLVNMEPRVIQPELVPPAQDAPEPLWTVRLPELPLTEPGENVVRLWVRNREPARSLEPAFAKVRYTPQPKEPPPPETLIVDPLGGSRTSMSRIRVRFEVKAAAPPARVELVREADGVAPLRVAVDVKQLRPVAPERYEGEVHVELAPGTNRLHADAGGGPGRAQAVVVAYLRMPLRLVFDTVQPWGPRGQALDVPDGNLASLGEVAQGRVYLHGRIVAARAGDDKLRALDEGLWVVVNGIRQLPAELGEFDPGSTERPFRVPVLLSRKSNLIRVATPDAVLDDTDLRRHTLLCREPAAAQRLHLVVVGAEDTDPDQLRASALRAVQAKPVSEEEFTTPDFNQGIVYRPLLGLDVSRQRLDNMLMKVRLEIVNRLSRVNPMNEVVLLYYQGREAVNERGGLQWNDVSSEDLEAAFASIPGVGLLLLDVVAPARERAVAWPGQPQLGVWRYAWRGPQAPNGAPALLAVLEETPRGRNLKAYAEQVSARFTLLANNFKELNPAVYLPEEYQDLGISLGK